MLRDVLRELLPNWHKRELIAQRAVGSSSENALQSLRRRIEMEDSKSDKERSTMDKNRNAKPAEDPGVIVAGTEARARARGEVKDDGRPREVRDAGAYEVADFARKFGVSSSEAKTIIKRYGPSRKKLDAHMAARSA